MELEINSNLCPSENMCLQESTKNNKFECIDKQDCKKLVAYLKFDPKILTIIKHSSRCIAELNDERFSNIINANLNSEITYKISLKRNFENMSVIALFSSLIPNHFDLKNIRLPIDLIECKNSIDFRLIILYSFLSISILAITITISMALVKFNNFKNDFSK